MSCSTELPKHIHKNGRNYFLRHQLENHKRALAGMPLISEDAVEIVEFVPAPQAAEELGYTRRTLGRRMKAAEVAANDGEAA